MRQRLDFEVWHVYNKISSKLFNGNHCYTMKINLKAITCFWSLRAAVNAKIVTKELYLPTRSTYCFAEIDFIKIVPINAPDKNGWMRIKSQAMSIYDMVFSTSNKKFLSKREDKPINRFFQQSDWIIEKEMQSHLNLKKQKKNYAGQGRQWSNSTEQLY